MRRRLAAIALGLAACRGAAVAPPATAPRPAPPDDAGEAEARDPVFSPARKGWQAVDRATRARIDALALDHAAALTVGKTPRRLVAELVRRFEAAGGVRLDDGALAAGDRRFFVARGGDAAAFVRVGRRPGALRVVVAASDAPRIDLKERAPYQAHGAAMLDTHLYGELVFEAWLARPLALHVHAERRGRPAIELSIGESVDEPVLMIPDVLPHLAGKIQANGPVTDPERLDALAAAAGPALDAALAAAGLDRAALVSAEAMLVPAGPARLIGVDRSLIGGYGQARRALAVLGVAALGKGPVPDATQIVVVTGKSAIGGTGATGDGFVRAALVRVLAQAGGGRDALATRRALATSEALIAATLGGERGKGAVLGAASADTLPAGHRRALDRIERSGALVQASAAHDGAGLGRQLGGLDLDALELGLPIAGLGTPGELVSVFDLFQAALAVEGFLGDD